MKLIIITLLISYYLCTKITNLNGYSSFASGEDGIINIDISRYELNDVIHFVIYIVDGEMNKAIYYGFTNNSNDISNTFLIYSASTSYSGSYCSWEDADYECGHEYYYDIKKIENKKYLRLKYSDYTGSSFYYNQMSTSILTIYLIFAIIFIVCYIGLCIFYFIYRYKKKSNTSNSTQEPILIPKDNQPLETL